MIPYLIPLFTLICGIIFYDAQGVERNRRWILIGVCIYLSIFYGLSYRLGWDTEWYMRAYRTFPTLSNIPEDIMQRYDYAQPGFILLWLTCRTLSPDYWLFHLIQCTFVNIAVFTFISRHTKYVFTASLIYYLCYSFYFNLEIVRESIAIGIFLLSYNYLDKHKWVKYYLCVFLSYMFHASALILVIFPIVKIYNLKLNYKFIIVLIIFLIGGFIAVRYIGSIIGLFGGGIGRKITAYMVFRESDVFNANWYIFRLARNVLIPLCIIVIYRYILRRKIEFEDMICLYILFGVGILYFEEISARFSNYPMPFYLLSIATLVGNYIKRTSRNKLIGYLTLAVILIVHTYEPLKMTTQYHQYYPYEWVLDPKDDAIRESGRIQKH